jgi:hypothetical protein
MIEYISELYVELQSDVCDAHERLARSWLISPDGRKLLAQQDDQRYVLPHQFLYVDAYIRIG